MISHLKVSLELPYTIILSQSNSEVGWAIIFPEKKAILVDPTPELLEYCQSDQILKISSKDPPLDINMVRFAGIKIYPGTYRNKAYLYLPEGILFTMGVPCENWPKLMKTLKIKLLLTPAGQVHRKLEAYLHGIMN